MCISNISRMLIQQKHIVEDELPQGRHYQCERLSIGITSVSGSSIGLTLVSLAWVGLARVSLARVGNLSLPPLPSTARGLVSSLTSGVTRSTGEGSTKPGTGGIQEGVGSIG